MKLVYLLVLAFVLSACTSTHSNMRGTVAMKTDNSTAHICMGDGEVKLGDKVGFYKTSCVRSGAGSRDSHELSCNTKTLGYGEVIKLINSHYSTVKTDEEVKFSEGTLVRKIN